MIIWGGGDESNSFLFFDTGGRYDPSTDSWIDTNTTGAPPGRQYHTAVWTGCEMIVWGGEVGGGAFASSGGRYCAQAGPTPTPNPTATPTATPQPSGVAKATPESTSSPINGPGSLITKAVQRRLLISESFRNLRPSAPLAERAADALQAFSEHFGVHAHADPKMIGHFEEAAWNR